MSYRKSRVFNLTEMSAKVLSYSGNGNPIVSVNEYGKGKVYFVNFPLESMLLDTPDSHKTNYYKIYRDIFAEKIGSHIVDSDSVCVGITEHAVSENQAYIVFVNYSGQEVKTNLRMNFAYKTEETVYGNPDCIAPFDAAVIKVSK